MVVLLVTISNAVRKTLGTRLPRNENVNVIIHNFEKRKETCLFEYRRNTVYINNSQHLGRKYARIFGRGHYLSEEAICYIAD